MNLVTIAFKSIRQRALASSLTALSVALGVMLMVAVLVINGVVEKMFSDRAIGYDLIVGPKGSDLQLVLSTVYRVSPPIENLPYKYYQQLKDDPRITHAIPFAFGDVTEEGAFPIVGTTTDFFMLEYAPGRNFRIRVNGPEGRRGRQLSRPFDAIIGSRVARANGWDIGSQFKLVHGGADSDHVHDELFEVVAVLAPTGTANDRTVFVHLDGFYMIDGHDKPPREALKRWAEFSGEQLDEREFERRAARLERLVKEQHDHHDHGSDHHHHFHDIPDELKEVTSVLLVMRTTEDAIFFSSEVNKGYKAQAVNPIRPMYRLMRDVVGNVRKVLLVLTGLIIVVSGVGIFVSIYNSMADRRREIAIMRALGAQRQTVFSIILAESVLLCFGGGLLGMLLGHGLVFAAAPYIEAETGILMNPLAFEPMELVLLPALIVLASLVGFLPALTAYRTDVAKTLAE